MDIKSFIKTLGMGVGVGETTENLECPACMGGATKEKSLSITRLKEGLLYNCFRVSCGTKGFVPSISLSIILKEKKFNPKPFTRSLKYLTPGQVDFFKARFDLTPEEVSDNGFKWCEEMGRYYMPVTDLRGYETGAVARSYRPEDKKIKTIFYPFNDVPKLYFPSQNYHKYKELVIVEDMISAIKVARVKPACAILGTGFNDEQAIYLSQQFDKLIFALDRDATTKAISFARKYTTIFKDGIEVVSMKQDPKDTTTEELKQIFT